MNGSFEAFSCQVTEKKSVILHTARPSMLLQSSVARLQVEGGLHNFPNWFFHAPVVSQDWATASSTSSGFSRRRTNTASSPPAAAPVLFLSLDLSCLCGWKRKWKVFTHAASTGSAVFSAVISQVCFEVEGEWRTVLFKPPLNYFFLWSLNQCGTTNTRKPTKETFILCVFVSG